MAISTEIKIDNSYAQILKALHKPGTPLLLANIYDPASADALLSLNVPLSQPVRAVATASYAVAASRGIPDEELTLQQNLEAIALIAPVVRRAGLPLTVDLQDGYGAALESAVQEAVRLGAVGANIEDSYPERGFGVGMQSLRGVKEQCERIRAALVAAKELGVVDFVVNARTDVFRLDPAPEGWGDEMVMEEAVRRGKAFLEAGATCVFVWGGGKRGLRTEEVRVVVKELGGRVSVKMGEGKDSLSNKELAEIGVCRVSIGPSLWVEAMKAVKKAAERILGGGKLWIAG